jgi:hypothetical protein
MASVKSKVPDGAQISETISRVADATFLGRDCIVLERRVVSSGLTRDRAAARTTRETVARLWISPDANFLPLKVERYRVDQPGRETLDDSVQVDELAEIEPGVFFPKKATAVVYEGKPKAQNTTVWNFDHVKLHPEYPIEQFRRVTFPEGSLVYVLRDGVITSSFEVGPDAETVIQNLLSGTVADTTVATPAGVGRASPDASASSPPPSPRVAVSVMRSRTSFLVISAAGVLVVVLFAAVAYRLRRNVS